MTLLGGTHREVNDAARIRQWLTMALLNNVLGGSSDTALRDMRRVLQEYGGEGVFPVQPLNSELTKSGRTAEFNDVALDNILGLTYGRGEAFLALSLLYDEHRWGSMQFHIDHIFPRSLFAPRALEAAGIVGEQRWRYQHLVNRLGNLQLLLPQENLSKLNQPFEQWLKTQHPNSLSRHLIPHDQSLYTFDRFEEFVSAREELIRQRLKGLFFAPQASEMRRPA
jgi:hypothetical protein